MAIQKTGSVKALGEVLRIAPQTISQWTMIPAKHVPALSQATGIPRHVLRPDLWEDPAAFERDTFENVMLAHKANA